MGICIFMVFFLIDFSKGLEGVEVRKQNQIFNMAKQENYNVGYWNDLNDSYNVAMHI